MYRNLVSRCIFDQVSARAFVAMVMAREQEEAESRVASFGINRCVWMGTGVGAQGVRCAGSRALASHYANKGMMETQAPDE